MAAMPSLDELSSRFGGNWKVVDDHPNYAVCDTGQIYGCRRNSLRRINPGVHGYRQVRIDGRHVRVARLVANAFIPITDASATFVDHIDRVRANDNVTNLRRVTNGQNKMNGASSSCLGIHGVERIGKMYRASIRLSSGLKNLGFYRKLEDAHLVRAQAAVLFQGEYAPSEMKHTGRRTRIVFHLYQPAGV
jgi:hypothetical protein